MPEEYRIILQPEAYEGMEGAYEYVEQDSPERDHQEALRILASHDVVERAVSAATIDAL